MRRLALALYLLAPAAVAQPTAADSALVDRTLDALEFEASIAPMLGALRQGPMGEMPGLAGVVDVAVIEDTVRARLLADPERAYLREALAFAESEAFRVLTDRAQAHARELERPGGYARLAERIENPKKGTLADADLARRYAEAQSMAERMPALMRRMFEAMAEASPQFRMMMDADPGEFEEAMAEMEETLPAQLDSVYARAARVTLYGIPEPSVREALAYHESPAGQYLSDVMSEATMDVVIPRVAAFFAEMIDAESRGPELEEVEHAEWADTPPSHDDPSIVEVAEVQPVLEGGLEALERNVAYPEAARRAGVEGRVIVQFVVDEEGRVVDPVAVRSPSPMLSEAALAAVRLAEFTPGLDAGEPVKVRFSLPVTFRLRDDPPDVIELDLDEAVPPPPAPPRIVNEPPPPPPPEPDPMEPEIFEVTEVQPVLIGGLEALQARVVYPESARAEGVGGRVIVQFVVDETGAVTDPVVIRSSDPRLDEAALAAVSASRFEPGRQRGRPVKVRFSLPVTFDPGE
jgi:TonB family protein